MKYEKKRKPKQPKTAKVNKNAALMDERFYHLRNAAYANLPLARKLIQDDPTIVSARNSLGETALHFLVVENQSEAVEFLAKHGSDVNTKNDFDASAIVEATRLGCVEMVDLLLNLGATVYDYEILEALEYGNIKEEKRRQIFAVLHKHGSALEASTQFQYSILKLRGTVHSVCSAFCKTSIDA